MMRFIFIMGLLGSSLVEAAKYNPYGYKPGKNSTKPSSSQGKKPTSQPGSSVSHAQMNQTLLSQQPYIGLDLSLLPPPLDMSNCDNLARPRDEKGNLINGVLPKRWCYGFNSGIANPQENYLLRTLLVRNPEVTCLKKLSKIVLILNLTQDKNFGDDTQIPIDDNQDPVANSYLNYYFSNKRFSFYYTDDEYRSHNNPFYLFDPFYLNELRKVKPVVNLNDHDRQNSFIEARVKPVYYADAISKRVLPTDKEIGRAKDLGVTYGSLILLHATPFIDRMINFTPIKIESLGANKKRIELKIIDPNEPAYFALKTQMSYNQSSKKWQRDFGGRGFFYLPEGHPWTSGEGCDLIPSSKQILTFSHDNDGLVKKYILQASGYPNLSVNSQNGPLPLKYEGPFFNFEPGVFTLESFAN